jgi:hypothetical protein
MALEQMVQMATCRLELHDQMTDLNIHEILDRLDLLLGP